MIEAKQAVQIAMQKAAEILQKTSGLEEIDRMDYNGHDVWSITLSLPRDMELLPPLLRLGVDPVKYKRFLIDTNTGELVAMKLHEFASR